ncbi:MAG: hypothetical protein D3923_10990, partial [Candidatus Electrothrix sp. AR3]|nr:hypothetical protein [Candidatus Electrothrix sp. AR3]
QAANAENRNLHVRLVGKDLRSPFDLTPSATVGLDKDDRQTAKDAKDKYNRKTKPGYEVFTVDEAKDALEKFATRPESGLSSPLSPGDDIQRGLEIHDQLEWACEELEEELEEKISYYIRLAEPVNQDSCLYDLHRWCPQILVFAVSSSDNRERKNCLSGLHRIIHRAEIFLNEQHQAEL